VPCDEGVGTGCEGLCERCARETFVLLLLIALCDVFADFALLLCGTCLRVRAADFSLCPTRLLQVTDAYVCVCVCVCGADEEFDFDFDFDLDFDGFLLTFFFLELISCDECASKHSHGTMHSTVTSN